MWLTRFQARDTAPGQRNELQNGRSKKQVERVGEEVWKSPEKWDTNMGKYEQQDQEGPMGNVFEVSDERKSGQLPQVQGTLQRWFSTFLTL